MAHPRLRGGVMTVRPRAIRAAMLARTSLRDLAAAAEARATDEDTAAREASARAALELDAAIAEAQARLAQSASVHDLVRVGEELAADHAAVVDAEQVRRTAAAALERATRELRQRERDLRTVERALDLVMEQRALVSARDEQRLTDDLGGRRRDS
jgi:hypothetical protein